MKALEALSGISGGGVVAYVFWSIFLSLPGCAQMGNLPAPGIHPGDAPITQREFVRTDVQTALDIATQGADKLALTCYAAIMDTLPAEGTVTIHPTGLLSMLEAGRVARLQIKAGIPDSVVSACAPVVLNSQAAIFNAFLFLRP